MTSSHPHQSDLEAIRDDASAMEILGAVRLAVEASRLTSSDTAFMLVRWIVEGWEPDEHDKQAVHVFIAGIKAVRGAK